jgi:hypothetical protein
MLRSIKELEQYVVTAVDGQAGSVLTFLLDEVGWAVRALVVRTSAIPGCRPRVAVEPSAFAEADDVTRTFRLSLTRERIRNGPDPRLDVSSAAELRGYHLDGLDGVIGRVEDSLVDDQTWTLRYLVIDARPWSVGQRVLVAPQWASRVSWNDRKVVLGIGRQAIKDGPEWKRDQRVDRAYEAALHQHHGRRVYWEEQRAEAAAAI